MTQEAALGGPRQRSVTTNLFPPLPAPLLFFMLG